MLNVGNSICNDENDKEECNFDGGDCEVQTGCASNATSCKQPFFINKMSRQDQFSFLHLGCFWWNEKQWIGDAPSEPVLTECGLNVCIPCEGAGQFLKLSITQYHINIGGFLTKLLT